MRRISVVFLATMLGLPMTPLAKGGEWRLEWEVREIAPGGRLDAVVDLGEGVLLAGSRNPRPGHVYRSLDCGETWTDQGNLLGDDPIASSITCLASGGGGLAFFLTGDGRVFRSEDWGEKWAWVGRPSRNPRLEPYQQSYGLAVLPSGTLLVSDTYPEGGHVFRSTDQGETWEDVGPVSPKALYRFEWTSDGVILNGWAGIVYKSTDDGQTWKGSGSLTEGALYATERLESGILLQGSEAGEIFRSTDEGETWQRVARLEGAADDFVSMGGESALYSVYTQGRQVHLTHDGGMTWTDTGPLPTDPGDVLDHVILADCPGARAVIGGSKRGWIVRAVAPSQAD